MPTTRQRRTRDQRARVSDEAVKAWRDGDYDTVAAELRLKPWECSPAWCETFRDGGAPCSDEEHLGCHRAQALRAELERRRGDNHGAS